MNDNDTSHSAILNDAPRLRGLVIAAHADGLIDTREVNEYMFDISEAIDNETLEATGCKIRSDLRDIDVIYPVGIDALPEPDGSESVEELVATWHHLADLANTISVHARMYSIQAAVAMDMEGHDQYETADGIMVHVSARSNDAWDGRRLLSKLAVPTVDTETGEMFPAVPVDVLADILPAIDGKSSKWLTRGLEAHGIDPDDYRTRTWSQGTLAKGPKR